MELTEQIRENRNDMELYDLPPRWVWATIGEIADTTSGGTPSRKELLYYENGTIPWLKSGELNDEYIYSVEEYITQAGLDNSSAKLFPADTALVALYGATVGRTGILGIDASTNQAICAIFPKDNSFIPKYMMYWLQLHRDTLIQMSSGGAQPNINQGIVRNFPIPLPPLPEQERIVEAIEAQLSRIEAGVASVRNAQSALRRYKASVLNAACTGQLLPQDPTDEPAALLLERILAERRARWEAEQREKYAAQGKALPKNWQDKYPAPAAPDTTDLPELPEGWVWGSVSQLSTKVVDGTHHTPNYIEDGVAFLSVKDVRNGRLHFDDCKYISVEEHEKLIARCYPQREDILITKSGTIGRIAIIKTDRPFSLFVSVALIKTIKGQFPQEYFAFALEHYIQNLNIDQNVKGGVIKNLHLEDLRIVPLPLPPLAEQSRIVAEVERRLSVVAALEQTIAATLQRAARLRQSVLRKAFRGELVGQEPNDEPAEALLARVL